MSHAVGIRHYAVGCTYLQELRSEAKDKHQVHRQRNHNSISRGRLRQHWMANRQAVRSLSRKMGT